MSSARLWREATLASDLEAFLARVGTALLDEVDANALVVRSLDPEQHQLVTSAGIRRGAVGVAHPARPRIELSASALARIETWIEAGGVEHVNANRPSTVARDMLRGVAEADDAWWMVPLVASSQALGVL